MSILGFDFYQGPEVPPPIPIDFTMDRRTVIAQRKAWVQELRDQIRYHDAWAILVVQSNLDVKLFDVFNDYAATGWGGTAYLLLAKEAT